jgi:putative FmdB family regulatory protein
MPIYAYRCESCGFAKDVLQKISDAPLTKCPECQGDTFRKQVTAAGFQLKGSGWYVTDFRGGSNGGGANSGGAAATATGKKETGESKPSSATETSTSTASSTPTATTSSSDA